MRTRTLLAAVAAVSMLGGVGTARAEEDPSSAARHELCGVEDLPETGLQGDVPKADQASGRAELGYNCGLALVGHTTLDADGRAPGGNANMAWAGSCAYVSGPGAVFGRDDPAATQGVAVVDVTDPAAPQHVRTLRGPGASSAMETIHAVETDGRAVLVVGEYGNQSGGGKPMTAYDVSDCADPVELGTFTWPENIHNLTISGNARYVYATQPLQVVDMEGLFDADPATGFRYVGNLEAATEYPLVSAGPGADLDDVVPLPKSSDGYLSHEAWPTHGGTKLYLGGQLPTFEVFTILDISEWLEGRGAPVVLSQRSGRGHSVRTATIGGTPYVLHSEESVFGLANGCLPSALNPFAGPAEAWLTDITDETQPVLEVSQLQLEINRVENCPAQLDSGVDSSVHYQDVDDPTDTSFVMASMWNAGLRVFDVRDPLRPVEVAYFNPGDVADGEEVRLDKAWGHVRYVAETGHIWFATESGGFWVVELEPQVRQHLGLDDGGTGPGPRRPAHAGPPDGVPPARYPNGRPARSGTRTSVATPIVPVDPAALYCTLGPLTS